MWNSDADHKIAELIKQDPKNTLCEKTWWVGIGTAVKCTRKKFEGIDCDNFKHEMFWDVDYKYVDKLANELSMKSRIDVDALLEDSIENENI